MKLKFEARFLLEVEKINGALTKKNGTKKTDKVHRRIGRLLEKYPSMNKYYRIDVQEKDGTATQVKAHKTTTHNKVDENLGVYFIRTNLCPENEHTLWTIYNTIRNIEESFRCLKTDLDLRLIYHKNDDATLAHLHLGLLGYWVVNTIRYQLKNKGINNNWQEILRITNTQKIITTTGYNTFDEIIQVRKCSEPSEKLAQIYGALNYKKYPFTKRKSVLPRSEFKKKEPPNSQAFTRH